MKLNKYLGSLLLIITLGLSFTACIPKEDSLPNLTGIDNTAKFKIASYDENGLNTTNEFANTTYQFGISEIFQIVKAGSIVEGKWKIEAGKIIIKDILIPPFTKLNNSWTYTENNAFNIVASAQNGSSVSNITFTKIP